MEPLTCNYSDGVLSLPKTHKNINSRRVYKLGGHYCIKEKDGTKDAVTYTEDPTPTASW